MNGIDSEDRLDGLRILIVEDLTLLADTLAETLEDCGCTIVGPVGRVQRALPFASKTPLDGAVLDVNLADELCFPIAAALKARGIPFIFLTGCSDESVFPPEFCATPRLGKPFVTRELVELAARQFSRAV
jgi:DNA-binding response OmpR family regulator